MSGKEPLTRLLRDWRDGDEDALEALTPVVYDELKRLARNAFRAERGGHTLQPTALVNEAYMKLVGAEVDWQDRAHFFAIAARIMRRILVNHANARRAAKRGGGQPSVTLNDELHALDGSDDTLILLDEVIGKLSAIDERKAQVIELHYFGGLTHKEMSAALSVSTTTLERDLAFAKAWLKKTLSADGAAPGPA